MPCAFCGQPVARFGAWRSSSNKFYCSEFCAEVEAMEPPPRPDAALAAEGAARPA